MACIRFFLQVLVICHDKATRRYQDESVVNDRKEITDVLVNARLDYMQRYALWCRSIMRTLGQARWSLLCSSPD